MSAIVVIPKQTFICASVCMVCDRNADDMTQTLVFGGGFPYPVFVHCPTATCTEVISRSHKVFDATCDRLTSCSWNGHEVCIPRSDGKMTKGVFCPPKGQNRPCGFLVITATSATLGVVFQWNEGGVDVGECGTMKKFVAISKVRDANPDLPRLTVTESDLSVMGPKFQQAYNDSECCFVVKQ